MDKNKLIIAAAGSGKTTFLVKSALSHSTNVLITTYTQANEAEIKQKIIDINKCIPENITVQTWFSFLLQHGLKPYQGEVFPKKINGMVLVNEQSGFRYKNSKGQMIYYGEENDFEKHYFTNSCKIYSDKLSKFVIRCNQKSNGNVIDRLNRIYTHIFIDEVQDLAGYDLEFIKLLFQSKAKILLVGDPRQVTYLTHNEKLYSPYKDGKIERFIYEKCKKDNCIVDSTSLKYSHRNNAEICSFSSKLYPNYPISEPCICQKCRGEESSHIGIFLVRPTDVYRYKETYNPTVLRYQNAIDTEWNYGKSKGLGFNRVLIYPTDGIAKYLKDGKLTKVVQNKTKDAFDIAKFYVAITRAKYSVAIVYDYKKDENFIEGLMRF